jgi:hypothetical protein
MATAWQASCVSVHSALNPISPWHAAKTSAGLDRVDDVEASDIVPDGGLDASTADNATTDDAVRSTTGSVIGPNGSGGGSGAGGVASSAGGLATAGTPSGAGLVAVVGGTPTDSVGRRRREGVPGSWAAR